MITLHGGITDAIEWSLGLGELPWQSANQLYVRFLGDDAAKELAGTENARGPFFSPDSAWIGYFVGGDLKKISSDGGPSTTICSAGA